MKADTPSILLKQTAAQLVEKAVRERRTSRNTGSEAQSLSVDRVIKLAVILCQEQIYRANQETSAACMPAFSQNERKTTSRYAWLNVLYKFTQS